jgi:fructose-1,6-bisphosphatase I
LSTSVSPGISLGPWLDSHAIDSPQQLAVARTVKAIAEAGRILSGIIAQGDLGEHAEVQVATNADGDEQKELDIRANDLIIELLQDQPVAWLASEELEEIQELNKGAPLAVAVDPLDGSSNVDTNLSVGTIFSVYDATADGKDAVLQCGRRQLAAGYIIYGPQTSIILTLGSGTHIFALDRARRQYFLAQDNVTIPETTREFAINMSNFRQWDDPTKDYIEDLLDGAEGTRGVDFNMRWLASLVAECQRILSRGGIFLYPGDQRPGYARGRLRLVYEANAIAWLVEQAGGKASTGLGPILDVQPTSVHERVPLIFGSVTEVERLESHYLNIQSAKRRSPLFASRGLFVNQGR